MELRVFDANRPSAGEGLELLGHLYGDDPLADRESDMYRGEFVARYDEDESDFSFTLLRSRRTRTAGWQRLVSTCNRRTPRTKGR